MYSPNLLTRVGIYETKLNTIFQTDLFHPKRMLPSNPQPSDWTSPFKRSLLF